MQCVCPVQRERPRPQDYKVSIGIDDGVIAEGQISYAGPGALARAELARQILEKRLAHIGAEDLRIDLIGLSSMHGTAGRLARSLRSAAASCGTIHARDGCEAPDT